MSFKSYNGTLLQLMQELKTQAEKPGIHLEDLPFPLQDCFKQFMIGRTAQGGPGERVFYHQKDVAEFYAACMFGKGLDFTVKFEADGPDAPAPDPIPGPGPYSLQGARIVLDSIRKNREAFSVSGLCRKTGLMTAEFWDLMNAPETEVFLSGHHVAALCVMGLSLGILKATERAVDMATVQSRMRVDLKHYEEEADYQQHVQKRAVEIMAEQILKTGAVQFSPVETERFNIGEINAKLVILCTTF